MSLLSFSHLSASASTLSLVPYLAAGVGLGLLHFYGLWWSARLFASGTSATAAIALGFARFILLGSFLAFASREGASSLLAMALGVLVVRPLITRSLRSATP